jgi:hypothetical protein
VWEVGIFHQSICDVPTFVRKGKTLCIEFVWEFGALILEFGITVN